MIVSAFEQSMILYAEHSFNASTFAARVVTSTQSDIYSAVTAAIGALKGPLHGGANEAVMHDMIEIGDPSKAAEWLHGKLSRKDKVMGFGHRVYKNGDSRVPTMKEALIRVAEARNGQRWLDIYDDPGKGDVSPPTGIKPNLDFPTGPGLLPDGIRHPQLHTAFRDEPDHRLDRPHHRAGRLQRADPAAVGVLRSAPTQLSPRLQQVGDGLQAGVVEHAGQHAAVALDGRAVDEVRGAAGQKDTHPADLAGSPARRNGTAAKYFSPVGSSFGSTNDRKFSVIVGPSAMQLTRTFGPHSWASDRVSWLSPLLAAP